MRILIVVSCVVAGLLGVGARAGAADATLACERALLAGSQKLAHAALAATASCETRKRAGKLPPGTECATEPKTLDAHDKASAALARTLAKRCGGADHVCATGDDPPPPTLGWPGTCPGFEGAACTAPIADCGAMATCTSCVDGAATDHARALLFDSLAPSDPKLQKALRRCQSTIGKEGAKLFDAIWKALGRCWDARLTGKHANLCPSPGNGKAAPAIAAAMAGARAKICKACGGHDGRCDAVDDIAVAEIGVAPACPGAGTCGGPISSVGDLADCLACTSAARAACAVALAAPSVAPYPPACAGPLPTPTVSATPPTTPTPTATPAPGCASGAGGVTDVTIVLDSATTVGGASLVLDYPPDRVRLPALGDVATSVADVSSGGLFGKGAPNNTDSNGDGEGDRVLFTVIAPGGVSGAILRVAFDRCNGAAATAAADYGCTVVAGTAVAPDGVTAIPGAACHVTLSP